MRFKFLILILIFIILTLIVTFLLLKLLKSPKDKMVPKNQNLISLFPPSFEGKVSVEEALLKRRSVRSFKEEPLTLKEISQILWAAQGITEPSFGGRTAPSAGALYPIEIYLIVKNVKELSPGVYKYQPENHSLVFLFEEKISSQLADAALGQSFIAKAPAVLVIAGVFERTTKKYGERGERYVFMEAGHVSQNVYLQCVSLNLGTVAVGAFEDEKVKQILKMDSKEYPLYIMPIGRK